MRILSIELAVTRKPILKKDLVICILIVLGYAYKIIIVSFLVRPILATLEELYVILLNHGGKM